MRAQTKLLLFLLLLNLTCAAQPINTLKLDSLFNSLAEHDLAMGSLTVSVKGAVVYRRAIGNIFLNGERKIAADTNTKYRIGSVSKMYTAVMIFQLVEEGKLNLEQTIDKYFTGLPNKDKITMAHLLSHRSGLHNYTEDTNFPKWMDKPKSQEDMLKIILEKGADFEPGIKAEYSNTNYLLLSYIIEKICGMSYADALNKRIVSKIALSNTYFGRPIDARQNESASYKYFDNTWTKETETNLNIHSGAGSIVSTPSDMVKFIEALFSYKLISKESLNQMKTFDGDYGMGMFLFPFGNKKGCGHNGKIEGFSASLQYFPDDKLTIAYCTNGQVYAKDDILKGVLSICFNRPYVIPTFKPVEIAGEELDKYLGKYVAYRMPITITCTKVGNQLFAETQGKVFEFNPIAKHHFMNAQYGYFFEFNPEKEELVLKETDNVFYLKKRKTPGASPTNKISEANPVDAFPSVRYNYINLTPIVFYNTYSSKTSPALKIKPGDTVHTESLDALGYDKDSIKRGNRGNPLTGPFFIEAASAGDMVAVTIVSISLNRNYATTLDAFIPKVLPKRLAKQTWRRAKLVKWNLDLVNNVATPTKTYEHLTGLSMPLHPFLGSVGVAPIGKEISSGGFGPWGGNLDFNSITKSATLYLPVFHEGALLYLGDGHAVQGDGELNGDALETSMNFAFTVRVIKNAAAGLKYPRVEDPDYIMAFGQEKNLDIALKEATLNLLNWLQTDYELSLAEASQVIGPAVEYKIPKLAAKEVEVVAMIRKDILKGLRKKD